MPLKLEIYAWLEKTKRETVLLFQPYKCAYPPVYAVTT